MVIKWRYQRLSSLFTTSFLLFSIGVIIALSGRIDPGAGAAQSSSRPLTGRVVGVSDGDTITVLGPDRRQYKIRLNGIDAPESSQEFGQVSKQNLARLVHGRQVRIEWEKQDRYERVLGRVFLDQTDINLEQVRQGLAWYYRAYERDIAPADRQRFDRAEQEARSSRRGLWRSATPTPPWDFRTAARSTRSSGSETFTRAAAPPAASNNTGSGAIRGNRNSGIYHLPECPDYEKISLRNRVSFGTEAEARQNGFRKAGNCP